MGGNSKKPRNRPVTLLRPRVGGDGLTSGVEETEECARPRQFSVAIPLDQREIVQVDDGVALVADQEGYIITIKGVRTDEVSAELREEIGECLNRGFYFRGQVTNLSSDRSSASVLIRGYKTDG